MKTHAFPLQLAKEAILLGQYHDLIHLIEPLSHTDNPDAQFLHAYLYFWDDNLDREQAIKLLTSAADSQHPEGNYLLAVCPELQFPYRFTIPQDEIGLTRLQAAADLGSEAALTDLAYSYFEGIAHKKDIRKARKLLTEAFYRNAKRRQYLPKCNYLLAKICLEGMGGKVDRRMGLTALASCREGIGDPLAIEAIDWHLRIVQNGEYGEDKSRWDAVQREYEPILEKLRSSKRPLWERFLGYYCMKTLKYDLREADFDAHADFVFDHMPTFPWDRDRFRWSRQAEIIFDPRKLLQFYTQLFQSPAFLKERYSVEQVEQGFGMDGVRGWGNWTIGCVLWDAENTTEEAVACIHAMFHLFDELLSDYRYSDTCYMWWDIGYGACADNWKTHSNRKKREVKTEDGFPLFQASFETMVRVLNLKNFDCQRAAIHGLGHWQHPDKEKVLREYVERPNTPDELRKYALSAIEGGIM